MNVFLPEAPSNHDLFVAEDGLLKMFALRKSAGWDVAPVVEAYAVLAATMAERSLIFKGLPEEATAGKNAPEDDDHDNDDQDGGKAINTGAGMPSNSEDRGKASDGAGSEKQTPRAKPTQKDGPVVVKESGAPPSFKHSSKDDGINTKSGTKSGKGGEGHRFLQAADSAGEDGVDGEDENLPDDGRIVSGKAKQNKSGGKNELTYANREVGKAAPAAETNDPAAHRGAPTTTRTSQTSPPDKANNMGAGAPPAETHYTPHPFAPAEAISSICATCGRAIADHVGKGYLEFELMEKEDFSNDQRRQFAEQGVALPDGSFPIPDEASLHNAVRLVGHAQDPQAAMTHIIERAKTMGMTHALPPAWNVPDAGADAGPPPAQGAHQLTPDSGGSGGAGPSKPKPAASAAPKPAAKPSTPTMKAVAQAMAKAYATGIDESAVLKAVDLASSPEFEQYVVIKSDARRYTQGPVYMPYQYDAHKEWTTYDELQKAMWDYVAETGAERSIYLQHTDVPAGHWVEVFQWHSPVQATMQKSIDGVLKSVSVDLPAGTAYMGVIWTPEAWELVKEEKITGFSMGGWARRVEAQIERLG